MFAAIFSYVSRLWDSTDRTATLQDAAFAAGVVAFICWLTHGLAHGKSFTPEWNQAALTFAGLVGLNKGADILANRPHKEAL